MSHVKLIAETRAYVSHKNMKSVGIFSQYFGSFRGKIYKKYSTGNEERVESETATITSDYVLSSVADKTNAPRKKLTILLYFFNSKRYRDFS